MKLYQDYKKHFNFILSLLIFSFLAFNIFPIFIHAQTAEELQDKIDQIRNNDIVKLEKEIAAYQSQLNDIGKQKNSLNSSLKELDLNRKKLIANIAVTQNKIANKNSEIGNLGFQINNKEESIQNDIKTIANQIKQTDEFESNSILEKIFSQDKISDTWKEVDTMMTLNERIREKIIEIRNIKTDLENTKKITEKARNELVSLKTELSDQKKIVEQNTTDKKKLLAETKNNEANYQKLLAQKLATKKAFEADLNNYESQLKFILDPKKLPKAGVLSWPLDYVYVTQLFGKTEAGKRLYANGSHSGVDFRASVGTPVKSMADGTVIDVGNTDTSCKNASFGKFVFIKYNNGLASTYGHLSLIKASKGQKVSRGDIVGYSGNTGYSTAPHLHVSLYVSSAAEMKNLPSKSCSGKILTMPVAPLNAYLDALYYLPPLQKDKIKP